MKLIAPTAMTMLATSVRATLLVEVVVPAAVASEIVPDSGSMSALEAYEEGVHGAAGRTASGLV